ncbi:MAG: hypothetical protein FJX77_05385, partial [Armatimonadetes bacterium]|nr:hypothetical protein [Armatimonadota bacterium]
RPDAIQTARTPCLDRLVREGTVCWTARTVMPSCTLPCHTSMLRGVDTARHGITTNQFQPLVRPVPSLIEAARTAGRRTGAFYNWEELRDLAGPGSLNVSFFWGDCHSGTGDQVVAEHAVEHLQRTELDLLFLYLGYPDECGHRHGWMSEPYLHAIENADACLARVLTALEEAGRRDETTVLVLSDHGGHERTHGTEMPEDMTIPWILQGPGVRPGVELDGGVRIFDTCVTLAHILGLPLRPEWEGRVVKEALT